MPAPTFGNPGAVPPPPGSPFAPPAGSNPFAPPAVSNPYAPRPSVEPPSGPPQDGGADARTEVDQEGPEPGGR